MMSLYAPDATFTLPRNDRRREEGDPAVLAHEGAEFKPDEQLGLRDAGLQGAHHGQRRPGDALLRVRLRRSEDRARSGSMTAADLDVARIDGQLADHEHGRSVGDPQSLRSCRGSVNEAARAGVSGRAAAVAGLGRQRWSSARVGRLPAKVHVKLLIAFVGTAVLVVAVGVLGLRVLGQSNDRARRLGVLQERAFAYGKLESDACHIRLLLHENPGPDFYTVNPSISRSGRGQDRGRDRQAVLNALVRHRPATSAEQPRLRAASGGPARSCATSARRASASRR